MSRRHDVYRGAGEERGAFTLAETTAAKALKGLGIDAGARGFKALLDMELYEAMAIPQGTVEASYAENPPRIAYTLVPETENDKEWFRAFAGEWNLPVPSAFRKQTVNAHLRAALKPR